MEPGTCAGMNTARDRRSTTHSPASMRRRNSAASAGPGANRSTPTGPAALAGPSHDLSASDVDYNFSQFSLNSGFAIKDASGNSAIIGLKTSWDPSKNSYKGASIPNIYSNDSGYSSSITDVTILDTGRLENNQTVSGADTNPGLIMGVNPVTLQIDVDLDEGTWTARAKYGTENWVNLTQDGTGLSNIASIEVLTSYLSQAP